MKHNQKYWSLDLYSKVSIFPPPSEPSRFPSTLLWNSIQTTVPVSTLADPLYLCYSCCYLCCFDLQLFPIATTIPRLVAIGVGGPLFVCVCLGWLISTLCFDLFSFVELFFSSPDSSCIKSLFKHQFCYEAFSLVGCYLWVLRLPATYLLLLFLCM